MLYIDGAMLICETILCKYLPIKKSKNETKNRFWPENQAVNRQAR